MLNGSDLDISVRRGDIYGLMIHNCVKLGNFTEAKQLVVELKEFLASEGLKIPLTYYVGKEVIEALARGLKVPVSTFAPAAAPKATVDNSEDLVDELLEG